MKQLAVFFAFILLVTHFTIVLFGIFSEKSKLPAWLTGYTQTVLKQPWKELGTDCTTSALQLEYRDFRNGSWNEWSDATSSFSYDSGSPLERIEQGINDKMRWEITHNLYSEEGRVQFNRITESTAYAEALYYVIRMNENAGNTAADSLQLRLAIAFTPSPNGAYTQQTSYLTFPVYHKP
jgi:hypothetical protein